MIASRIVASSARTAFSKRSQSCLISTMNRMTKPCSVAQLKSNTNMVWTPRFYSDAAEKNSESDKSETKKEEESKLEEKDKSAELLAEKDKEIAGLKDRLLRAVADYENLQRITEREKQQTKEYAIRSFAGDLVANLDILHIALRSVAQEKRSDRSESNPVTAAEFVDLYTGVEMTSKELEKTLNRFGVQSFDPTGEQFDPNKHEALYQAPIPGKEPGSVIECQKTGWLIKDRLLRAAQVGVVLNPEQ